VINITEEIGEDSGSTETGYSENNSKYQSPNRGEHYHYYPPRKLYRSTRNKWLGGVCGGLAEYYDHDPTLIRILWVALTLVSMGAGIIAYILLWIFIKKYPTYYQLPVQPTGRGKKAVHYHYYYDR
jgi:phage shock protein PspC (stress-responsive transcriptional regulator)